MNQEQQAPQNESNAGGGMLNNPVRKHEQEAAQKVAGHPGDANNAAGMNRNATPKDHNDECRQGEDKDWLM